MKRTGVVSEETVKRQKKLIEELDAECEAVNDKEKAIQAQIEELQKQLAKIEYPAEAEAAAVDLKFELDAAAYAERIDEVVETGGCLLFSQSAHQGAMAAYIFRGVRMYGGEDSPGDLIEPAWREKIKNAKYTVTVVTDGMKELEGGWVEVQMPTGKARFRPGFIIGNINFAYHKKCYVYMFKKQNK
jgi:hypothetical protein